LQKKRTHHNKLFKPPLPQNKMDAIENMGFGKVNKIFLYFEKPFWTKGKGGVKLSATYSSSSHITFTLLNGCSQYMAETTFPNFIVFFGISLLRQLVTLENPLGIFTFPPGISLNILGYLKLHHNKLFKPPLPQNKMDAIENMGFGKVNKIFLYFEKPYWTKGKGGVKLAWNHTSNSFEESQWYTSIFAFK
jgi:monoamine oxidase